VAIRGPGLVAEVDRVDRISLRVVDTLTAAISRYHSLGGATGIRRRGRQGRCDENAPVIQTHEDVERANSVISNVRRICLGGSMPPGRLRRRNFLKI